MINPVCMVVCSLGGMPRGFPRVSATDRQEIQNDSGRNKLLTSYGDEERLNYRGKMSWKEESMTGLGNPSRVSVCAGLSHGESHTRLTECLRMTNFKFKENNYENKHANKMFRESGK